METLTNLKQQFLRKSFYAEIALVLLSIIGFILISSTEKLGLLLFIISLVILALIYFISMSLRAPNKKENDPDEMGYRSFTIRLLYMSLIVDIVAFILLLGLQNSEGEVLLLTMGLSVFIVTILSVVYYLIKFGKGDAITILDYSRTAIAGVIILGMYISRGIFQMMFPG
jgi:fatty acid desaturase